MYLQSLCTCTCITIVHVLQSLCTCTHTYNTSTKCTSYLTFPMISIVNISNNKDYPQSLLMADH